MFKKCRDHLQKIVFVLYSNIKSALVFQDKWSYVISLLCVNLGGCRGYRIHWIEYKMYSTMYSTGWGSLLMWHAGCDEVLRRSVSLLRMCSNQSPVSLLCAAADHSASSVQWRGAVLSAACFFLFPVSCLQLAHETCYVLVHLCDITFVIRCSVCQCSGLHSDKVLNLTGKLSYCWVRNIFIYEIFISDCTCLLDHFFTTPFW